MNSNDKFALIVGTFLTLPVTLMVLIEPERAMLFGRIFVAVVIGMAHSVGL